LSTTCSRIAPATHAGLWRRCGRRRRRCGSTAASRHRADHIRGNAAHLIDAKRHRFVTITDDARDLYSFERDRLGGQSAIARFHRNSVNASFVPAGRITVGDVAAIQFVPQSNQLLVIRYSAAWLMDIYRGERNRRFVDAGTIADAAGRNGGNFWTLRFESAAGWQAPVLALEFRKPIRHPATRSRGSMVRRRVCRQRVVLKHDPGIRRRWRTCLSGLAQHQWRANRDLRSGSREWGADVCWRLRSEFPAQRRTRDHRWLHPNRH
jgi:hypothetical protein